MPIDPDRLYRETETAEFVCCSIWTLQAHRKRGWGIPWVKNGVSVRYLGRDIQEYVNARRVDPAMKRAKGKPAPASLQNNVGHIPPHLRGRGMRGFV